MAVNDCLSVAISTKKLYTSLIMKTSNKFTLFRMISAPILFVMYFLPIWLTHLLPHIFPENSLVWKISWVLVVILLIISELTDYWDGAYARKYGEVSDFGKMFDPFADVFLHLSMFTCFVFDKFMPTLAYILIFYREFAQNFLRMIAAKNGIAIAARKGGKVKTVFYVISCFVALALEGFRRFELEALTGFYIDSIIYVSYGFFAICVILAYVSFIDYLRIFGSNFKDTL